MDRLSLQDGFTWGAFESIENDLIRIVEYIPLETEQYDVYSFQLSDIIKRACSQIDSVFKEIVRVCELKDYPDKRLLKEYVSKIKGNKNILVTDHAKLFSDYYNLEKAIIIIRKNYFSLKPFNNFTEKKTPKWWQDYNKLKHDYFNNVHLGTLGNALDSLGALFILHCKIRELYTFLAYNEIFSCRSISDVFQLKRYVEREPELEKFSICARSKLFEYWVSINPLSNKIRVDIITGAMSGIGLDEFHKKYGEDWYKKFQEH